MMFTCEDVKSRWPEYLYRELDEHEQAQCVQHIQQCSACRREERQWASVFSRFDVLAAGDGTNAAPQELIYRVKRQIQFYQDWSQQALYAFRLKLAVSVVVCTIFFSGLWFSSVVMQKITFPERIMDQLSESVLNDLYSQSALDMFRENGILENVKSAGAGISFLGKESSGFKEKQPSKKETL